MCVQRPSRATVVMSLSVLTLLTAPVNGGETNQGRWLDVRQHGATGAGKVKDTAAIQAAIDAAHAAGGGTVHLPPGTYLSGTLRLKSNVTLHVAAGATLLGSTDLNDYPEAKAAFRSYTDNYVCRSLLAAEDAHNISIVGGGTIDGQGAAFKAKPPEWGYRQRPYIIRFVTCGNVRLEGVTLRNSAMWVQHYLACDNVTIRGVTVDSQVNSNNDGINIDCCRYFHVSDCHIKSGDDAIVLKSTADRVCENVTVTNCALTTHCNGFKLGTESNGGFRNIVMSNLSMYDIGLGGISLMIVDGGTLDGVAISNVTIDKAKAAIFCRLGDRGRPFGEDMPRPGIGVVRNVTISNVVARNLTAIGSSITGLPEHPVEDVSLSHIMLESAGSGTAEDAGRAVPELPAKYPESSMFGTLPAHGLYCRHVKGLSLTDIDLRCVKPDSRPALVCDDVQGLAVSGLRGRGGAQGSPFLHLNDSRDVLVQGCRVAAGAGCLAQITGASDNVSLFGNDVTAAASLFQVGSDTPAGAIHEAANRKAAVAR